MDHRECREWDRDLHPGDIVLTHFRGREELEGHDDGHDPPVPEQGHGEGYAVARLEDYL